MNNQANAANCGLYWVANSIVSVVMGLNNRNIHEKAAQDNLDFQRELEDARTIAQDEIEAEKVAFKRRMMKLSRQYRQEESLQLYDQQLKSIELQSFIDKYWPLADALPYVIIKEIENSRNTQSPLPLNVILLHAPLMPPKETPLATKASIKDIDIYRDLELRLEQKAMSIGDVKVYRDCCINTDFVGGNANMMNIHFLMSTLPTLVISPKYNKADGKMEFNTAVWEAQSTRPLIRPLFSIDYEPLIAEQDKEYCKQSIEKFETALTLIIGATRDSYMLLTQGKRPMLQTMLSKEQKQIIRSDENLSYFAQSEYKNIVSALGKKDIPQLLEAYSEVDIQHMQSQANECLTF